MTPIPENTQAEMIPFFEAAVSHMKDGSFTKELFMTFMESIVEIYESSRL